MVCRGSIEAYALFDCLRIGESLLVLGVSCHRINVTMTAKRFGIGLRKAAAVVGAGDRRRVVGMRFWRTT